MTKTLGLLIVLCCIAAACGSAATTTTVPEPATDAESIPDPAAEPAGTTTTEPAADPEETGTTTTSPEPAASPEPTDETDAAAPEPAADPEAAQETETEESDTTTTTTEQAANPEPAEETDTTTTSPEPAADPEPTDETDSTTTTPEPVADRVPADPEAPTGGWTAGINAAGWDFHRHLTGNAVSSPVSIGVTFSLSRAGASADSGATLDRIFGFPAEGLHNAANAVGLSLAEASVEPTTLEVANRLFPDDEFSPRPEFLEIAATHYGAIVEPIDTADADAAADTINRWASESTRGLIPRIVDADAVQNQQLVLANTVYLKADWHRQFLAEDTGDGQFTTGDGRSVTVPFMRDREAVQRRYVRLQGADAVELPYQGGQLAMWLVVPHSPAGLAAVEESLDADTLTGLQGAAQSGRVEVIMPKWEQTLPPTDLFGWLCPQGFCVGAGLDGIAPGIFVSSAFHGAKVIVDEKGTEAAAATAMAGATSVPPPPDLTIVADRPFLWAIVHQHTGALLFVGRLVDPAP